MGLLPKWLATPLSVRRQIGRLVLGLWVALMATQAMAQDRIIARALVHDPAGDMTLDEVQAAEAEPFPGVLSLGYGGTLWVRLTLPPSRATEEDRLFLRMRPAYLDEVVLFDAAIDPTPRKPIGDRYPMANQDVTSAFMLWEIPPSAAGRDLWLRLTTTSTRLAHFELLAEPDLQRSNARLEHLGALYIGLIFAFCLWGIAQWLFRPDWLIASFLLSQSTSMGFGAGLLGASRLVAPPSWAAEWVDMTTSIFVLLASFGSLLFSLRMMEELGPARWRHVLLGGLCLAYLALFLLLLGGRASAALHGNMLVLLLSAPVLLVIAIFSRFRQREASDLRYGLSKPAVVMYFALTTMFSTLTAVPSLGLVQAGEWNLYVVLFYSLTCGMLMVAVLQYRGHLLLQRQSALAAEAEQRKAQAIKERELRLEREATLDMLGHELQTPLATVQLTAASNKIPRHLSTRITTATQDMAMVLERTLQTGRLEGGSLVLHRQDTNLTTIVNEVLRRLPDSGRVRWGSAGAGDPAPLIVRTDPLFMSLVLRNLLDNAIKYSPEGSPVDIDLTPGPEPGGWIFCVENLPGRAGLPDPTRVFDKYYRSPGASHRTGSGLGLYLVQGIVQRLGGTISYEVKEGRAHFCLTMRPVDKEDSV